MTEKLNPTYREQWLGRIPLRRFGEPEEVANAVLFLASDAASYISGATLHINGGGYPA
jgi:3-oxoacyl-[acyl-carrier protein] reductase